MSRKTVLVVDPNPANHRRVQGAFRGSGFPMLFAKGLAEAQVSCAGQTIDLILSAVRLPKGTGYDLARILRESYPAALVYLMAGGFDVYDAARAAESGVDGKISVPFTPASLRARVEEAIGPLALGLPEISTSDLAPMDDVPSYDAPIATYDGPMAAPATAVPDSDERMATFLPRDFRQPEPVAVDPAVVGPALERAILEVLPEVVEGVLRNTLVSSPDFRELVAAAVEKAVKDELARRG
ncbi:MAG: response regulator [Proteobacteria bacterium]|nr:response regulator [Pseudomonadota bacterium]MCP4918834.1 response regulator [Pseudomonadota bacterium]